MQKIKHLEKTDIHEEVSYDRVKVTVFIGAFLDDNLLKRGIGLCFGDGEHNREIFLYDSEMPAEDLWRGMEILRHIIPLATRGLLTNRLVYTCFHAGDKHRHDLGMFSNAYRIFGGYQSFNQIRREILEKPCPKEETDKIDKFLRHFRKASFMHTSREHFAQGAGQAASAA